MPTANYVFKTCITLDLAIGESPVWDDIRNVLWFVDVVRPAVFRFDPTSGGLVEHLMPSDVGSLGLLTDGRLIVALRSGIHFFDPATGKLEFLVHPEPDRPMNRMNDGKIGPDGCFWVGSMHDSQPREPTGRLYRITPAGEVTRILDDVRVSNGLAWSPDGRTMYHADTRGPSVRCFDFDPDSGAVSNCRTMTVLDEAEGLPDGAAMDVQGCYWSAGVTAGVLNKFSPDGQLLKKIALPVDGPTMPCFGGPELRTLFITSLASDRGGRRMGGSLIACRMDVAGVPVHRMPSPQRDAGQAA